MGRGLKLKGIKRARSEPLKKKALEVEEGRGVGIRDFVISCVNADLTLCFPCLIV